MDFDSLGSVELLIAGTNNDHFHTIASCMGYGRVLLRFVGGYFQAKYCEKRYRYSDIGLTNYIN